VFKWLKKCWRFLKAEADLHTKENPIPLEKVESAKKLTLKTQSPPHPRQHIIDQIEEVGSDDPRLWEYFTEEETDDTDD